MTALKDLLTQVADEARLYDGTDRAVRAMRRRRTAARLAPVAAALLVMVVVVSALALSRGSEPGPSPVAAGLPTLLSPAHAPPELPSDRGVGPASLAYLRRANIEDDGKLRLVTTGGRHYALPWALRVVGISPDGRWVLWAESQWVVLRDLTGTERHEFPAAGGWVSAVWSPDGRRLVVQFVHEPVPELIDQPGRDTVMVDLRPLAQRTVPLTDNHDFPCALRNSGLIVLCPRAESSSTNLRLVDGGTGRTTGEIDVHAWMRPGEGIGSIAGPLVLRPDDTTLLLPLLGPPAPTTDQSDLVAIDIDGGRVTARYPLPDRLAPSVSKAPDGSESHGESDRRELAAAPADGVLLVHISPRANDRMSGRVVAIEMVAPETGALTVVTRVSGDIARIFLPGGNY